MEKAWHVNTRLCLIIIVVPVLLFISSSSLSFFVRLLFWITSNVAWHFSLLISPPFNQRSWKHYHPDNEEATTTPLNFIIETKDSSKALYGTAATCTTKFTVAKQSLLLVRVNTRQWQRYKPQNKQQTPSNLNSLTFHIVYITTYISHHIASHHIFTIWTLK